MTMMFCMCKTRLLSTAHTCPLATQDIFWKNVTILVGQMSDTFTIAKQRALSAMHTFGMPH